MAISHQVNNTINRFLEIRCSCKLSLEVDLTVEEIEDLNKINNKVKIIIKF